MFVFSFRLIGHYSNAYLPNDLNHLGNFVEPSPEVDVLDAVLKLDDELGLCACCDVDVDGLFSLLDVWLNKFGACFMPL